MTISQHDLQSRPGPVYRALADALGEAIAEGRFGPGEKLLPQREMAWQLKVTVGTVSRAYDLLIKRSLARGEVGRGTFVLEQTRPEPLGATLDPVAITGQASGGKGVIDLSVNQPVQGCLPDDLARIIAEAATSGDLASLVGSYQPAIGMARHRRAAAAWLKEIGVVAARPEDVLFTAGAQGGLTAALAGIGRAGDPVVCEALTYNGIRRVIGRLGMHAEPVAIDDEGIMPGALVRSVEHSGARILVLTARLANPTLATMSPARRRDVATIVRRYGLTVIEDDVYGPLARARAEPFASEAPECTIHLTSLSKFLSPGLRFGILRAPAAHFDAIASAQADLNLGESPFLAEVFARVHAHGLINEAIATQRTHTERRLRLARSILEGAELKGEPEALHVWLSLPTAWTAGGFALSLARNGVVIASGERFRTAHGAVPLAVRISIGAPAEDATLADGLRQIADLLACTTQTGAPLV